MKRKIRKGTLAFLLILSGSALFSQEASATAISANETTAVVSPVETNHAPGKPSITDLPGFPVFVNTGDPVGDDARYEAAKTEWYAQNKRLVKKFYRQN